VRLVARDLPEPSALAHEVLNSAPWAYLDDAPLEERRSRAVSLRRTLPEKDGDLGALDPAAIAEVAAQAWPEVRDARDLHDALLCLGLLPDAEVPAGWRDPLAQLASAGRAVRRGEHWAAADRPSPEVVEVVRGWVTCLGPFTAAGLAGRLRLPVTEVELAQLESEGLLLRGRFTPGAGELEWCERTLLARIHRLTLGRLRREIEPVSTSDVLRFLFRWQHVQPGTQVHGAAGLSEVLGQLQGFQAGAGAWEGEILAARVAGYEPALLDRLCVSGEAAWGRLCSAPIDPEGPRRRAAPNRLTPIALARREDLPWLLDATRGPAEPLGERARRLQALLQQRGALFFHELSRGSGLAAADLEAGLWELVSAGLASSDGFAAVRFLTAPHRRTPASGHPLSNAGRWSLLRPPSEEAPEAKGATGDAPAWLDSMARQYLRRYGLVFRDLLAREPRCPPWRELARVYRRMEARGELRGGRFAQAFSGEQFALPEALDALRSVRRTRPAGTERVQISAGDPLNLVGILTPGARVPAQSGARIGFVDGVPDTLPALASA